jgi:hypothetical protein
MMFVFDIAVLRVTFLPHHVDKFRQCTDNVTFMDHSFSLFNNMETAELNLEVCVGHKVPIWKCALDIKCLFGSVSWA